jgi:hypothetical protein
VDDRQAAANDPEVACEIKIRPLYEMADGRQGLALQVREIP